jgi:hypothetical protein
MANVVDQGQSLGQIFVQPQGSGHCPRDRSDLERVRQSRPVVDPHFTGKHLHLSAQSPKRTAVQDPITVTRKRSSIGVGPLGVIPAAGVMAVHRVRCQQLVLTIVN